MREFLKVTLEFQDEVIGDTSRAPPEMGTNLLADDVGDEEAIDRPNVDFKVAFLVASIEADKDIELSLGYTIENSSEQVQGGVVFEDPIIDEEESSVKRV